MLEGSVEGGLGRAESLSTARWTERFMFSLSRHDRGRVVLRLQNKVEEKAVPWVGPARSGSRLLSLRLESPAALKVSGRAELKIAKGDANRESLGTWGELTLRLKRWQIWGRFTRTEVADGLPIYWYERVPAGAWGLRAAWKPETRLAIGASGRPEGWHLQAVLGPGRRVGLHVGCRL
jgi:hypothetical protein